MRRKGLAGMFLLLLLVIVPSVSACSLREPLPFPARMWIWDVEEAMAVEHIDTWTRGLGASCGLKKPVDLDGGRFVYADRAGDSMGVWLLAPGEERPWLVFRLDGDYKALDLDGDRLSIYMETVRHGETRGNGGVPARYGHVFTVDLDDGDAERIDLAPDRLGDPRIQDSLMFWAWVDRSDYRHRLNVYDLREREWVHKNVSYTETFGLGEKARMMEMNARWMLMTDEGAVHAWDRQNRTMHTLAWSGEGLSAVDGDRLYRYDQFGSGVEMMRLPDGKTRAIADPEHPVMERTAVDDSLMVLGVYSHQEGRDEAPSWMQDPEIEEDFAIPSDWRHEPHTPWYLNVPASHALFVVLAVLAVLRSRLRRPDR